MNTNLVKELSNLSDRAYKLIEGFLFDNDKIVVAKITPFKAQFADGEMHEIQSIALENPRYLNSPIITFYDTDGNVIPYTLDLRDYAYLADNIELYFEKDKNNQ